MKKIPSLFVRDPAKNFRKVLDEVSEDVDLERMKKAWATRKWDGTCCAVIDGEFYRRHRHKPEKGEPPVSWVHHSLDPAQESGHGWVLVGDHPSDRLHAEAYSGWIALPDGTYELCGPKVQSNPDKFEKRLLIRHGDLVEEDAPKDFEGLKTYLSDYPGEGLVWWDEDGPVAKIKRKDF